jgi:hypothetical protein
MRGNGGQVSGNGGQVEIPGPDLTYMGSRIIQARRARAGRNNFQILKIQMIEDSYFGFVQHCFEH